MNPTGKLIAFKPESALVLNPALLSRIGVSNQAAIAHNAFVVRTSQSVEEIYKELESEFGDSVGFFVSGLCLPCRFRGDNQEALKAMGLADQ